MSERNPFDQFDGAVVDGPVLVPSRPGAREIFSASEDFEFFSGTLSGAIQGKYDQAFEKQKALDRYNSLPQWETPLEYAAGIAGHLYGAAQSFENYIPITLGAKALTWAGVKSSSVTARFAAGAIDAGVINAGVDAGVQAIEIGAGQRQSFDPVQFGTSVALGAAVGGTANAAFGSRGAPGAGNQPAALADQPLAAETPAAGNQPQLPDAASNVAENINMPPLDMGGQATGQLVAPRVVSAEVPALGETLDAQARQVRELGPSTVTAPQRPALPSQSKKALDDYISGSRPLTAEAFAKASGLSPEDAGRALQQAALSGRIIQGKDGNWRRPSIMRNRPMNVIEFIASIGGLRDEQGELRARDLNARSTMTRFGPMARKNGLSADEVRERLVEAGFLDEAGFGGLDDTAAARTTENDVFDLIDRQLSSQPVVARADVAWQGEIDAARQADLGQDELQNRFEPDERDLIENHGVDWTHAVSLAAYLREVETPASTWTPGTLRLASDLMADGADAGQALERAAMMGIEGDFDGLSDAAQRLAKGEDIGDIPGWETADELSSQGGGVPPARGETAGDGRGAGGESLPRADGGDAGAAGQGPAVEPGADGKPQTVLDGAGRASDADMAQRRADAPLRAKAPQNFIMDEGLFGDSKDQLDFLAASPGSRVGSITRDAQGRAGMGTDPAFMRVQDISERLAQALEAPAVRQGRLSAKVGSKTAAGQYGVRDGVIRVGKPDDFDVLTHELGHWMEAAIGPPVRRLMREHKDELVTLAYPGAAKAVLLEEGFAEFMRLFATNPIYARNAAPAFDAALRDMLAKDQPDILRALKEAAAAWRDWNNQPSADAVASTIVSSAEPKYFAAARKDLNKLGLGGTIADRLSRGYTMLFDDLNPISKAVRQLAKMHKDRTGQLLDLKDIDDSYKLGRMARGAWNAGHMDISHGVTPYRGAEPGSASLRDALVTAMGKPNVLSGWDEQTVRRFGAYLWSRRALGEWDRFDAGDIPNPPDKLSKGDHAQNVAESEAAFPQFAAAADMVYDWSRALWTKKRDAGLITQEQWAEGLKIRDYVPGLRSFDGEGDTKVGEASGRGGSIKSGLVKRFRGSRRDVINPVESLIADAYETSMAIARNDVVKTLDRLARMAGPGGGAIAERIPSHRMKGMNIDPLEAVESAAREAGLAKADIVVLRDAMEAAVGDAKAAIFRPAVINEKGEPIAFYRDGGELKALRLADGKLGQDMFAALTQMTRAENNVFINLLAKPAAISRIGVTASPEFIIANLVRDQVTSMIFYGQPFKRLKATGQGLKDELLQRETARRYNAAYGIMGGAQVAAVTDMRVRADIQALRKKGWLAQRLTSVQGLLEITEVTETATRLGLFRTFYDEAKARGLSDIEATFEASYRARDHIDFNRRGSAMMGIARLIPFLNASLQGADKEIRQMISPLFREVLTTADLRARSDAVKAWARVSAWAVAGVGLYALMSQYDEFNDMSPQVKATHWVIKWGDKWFFVPKPFGLLSMVMNTAEAAWDAVARQDPRWASSYLDGLMAVGMPPNVMEGNPAIAGAFELATGTNVRTGMPIVPEGLEGMEPWLQFSHQTSQISKEIGKATNMSPAIVDHMILSFTTSLGRNALALYDYALADKPLQGWDDFAVTRRFIKDGARGARSTTAFWELVGTRSGKLEGARRSYQSMVDGGDPAGAADYLAQQDAITRAWVAAGSVKAEVRRVHPFIRARSSVEAINQLRREMSGSTIRTASGEIEVNRVERGAADDILEDLAMTEARNALVMMGVPGWKGREMIETATYFRELEAASPALARALADRFATAKVLPMDAVERIWPEFEARLLRDGSDLATADLAARAKAAGFEMDGKAMKRRPRAKVPAGVTLPAP